MYLFIGVLRRLVPNNQLVYKYQYIQTTIYRVIQHKLDESKQLHISDRNIVFWSDLDPFALQVSVVVSFGIPLNREGVASSGGSHTLFYLENILFWEKGLGPP